MAKFHFQFQFRFSADLLAVALLCSVRCLAMVSIVSISSWSFIWTRNTLAKMNVMVTYGRKSGRKEEWKEKLGWNTGTMGWVASGVGVMSGRGVSRGG